jgi:hypothetical protein
MPGTLSQVMAAGIPCACALHAPDARRKTRSWYAKRVNFNGVCLSLSQVTLNPTTRALSFNSCFRCRACQYQTTRDSRVLDRIDQETIPASHEYGGAAFYVSALMNFETKVIEIHITIHMGSK